ncbi:carboxymuconolactone decarboxylase family protein [Rhodospirillaceae bacterium]|jgi:alkylhydroperoxidase/carboxymuconolactone decarboxylase family protein YurZ|nr:carboxymuconolactone decarboxylase family protein [Rhodospirillaceae bacterium]MDC1442021.1 carboxymuconolactone decarboxylase family protein [Rhodospirillaceae bacterium]
MSERHFNWTKALKFIDPDIEQYTRKLNDFVINRESEIPKKYKELILVACSAAIRHQAGTRIRGYEAMHHGASDKEIIEAISLASFASSSSTLSEGIEALGDQLTLGPELSSR